MAGSAESFIGACQNTAEIFDTKPPEASCWRFSEKQMAIITKNAPAALIEKIRAGDVAAGRKFLDEFFKKLDKDNKKKTPKKKAARS